MIRRPSSRRVESGEEMKHDGGHGSSEDDDEDDECPVCMETRIQSVLPCGHGFCSGCITVRVSDALSVHVLC